MSDELLDLVNEKDEVIGTVWKSEAHKDPTKIHREVALIIFDTKGGALLQQRSMNKEVEPGQWKITAAGHVGSGEDPKRAIVRETYEELGIKVNPVFFGKRFVSYRDKESRFFWTYYAIISRAPKLKLDLIEVMDARWVNIKDIKKFAKENSYSLKSNSHKFLMEVARHLKLDTK